jgi:hypothetical protein
MKKSAPLIIAIAMIFFGLSSFASHHSHKGKAPAENNGQDSTKHHQNDKHHGHLGGTTWNFMVVVTDQSSKPISGATVAAPCTGGPSKVTNASGVVQFSGNAPCPCSAGYVSVTTPKGCNTKTNVTCDSTFNVQCNQPFDTFDKVYVADGFKEQSSRKIVAGSQRIF